MLRTGLKSGNLADFRYLNMIAKTAEQISNVNICSKILGLSDAGGTDTANYIYHTQIRDRITLVSVYVSSSSLSSPSYPSISTAVDENGTSLIGSYNFISAVLEEFDHVVDGITYKVTFLKKTYAVAIAALNKRVRLKIYPLSSSAKDFDATYLNSMFIMQIDSSLTGITLAEDEVVASYEYINKMKEAFRLNMSYNLAVIDTLGNKQLNYSILNYLNVYNDLYEVLSLTGERAYIGYEGATSFETGTAIIWDLFLQSTITAGTLLDYTIFTQTQTNINKLLDRYYLDTRIANGLSLTTTDTLNKSINSIYQDALNSYDLVMLNRDFANRLQGKLYYPTIGRALVTEGNPETPIDLDIIMNNNIDNMNFSHELTLINGYKLKFSIS